MFLLFLQAFGYLVPSHQQSKVLGVVFDSSTFPELDTQEHSSTRLTVWHCIDTQLYTEKELVAM